MMSKEIESGSEAAVKEEQVYKAQYKFAPMSAQKARAFADLIRGKYVDEAEVLLNCYPNRGAKFLGQVLKSAKANAEDLGCTNVNDLVVIDVRVDGGPMFKRFRPKSRGMSTLVKKRMSHITVKLG